ncbi:helix-turn-helix domain-containing protein [Gordonia sp. CPCC 205333]|uniref:helix-turn-helix domain-containing protein n=1 Tax=Gordonia sp. CPCC 205333 TaxID=3140790 RepID=UPI003AF33E09
MTQGIAIRGKVPNLNRLTIRLSTARDDAGLSQPGLAEAIGTSRGTVSNYERGTVKPRRSTLILWAMATGVDLHWLETGEAPSPEGDGASELCAIRDLNPEPAD